MDAVDTLSRMLCFFFFFIPTVELPFHSLERNKKTTSVLLCQSEQKPGQCRETALLSKELCNGHL